MVEFVTLIQLLYDHSIPDGVVHEMAMQANQDFDLLPF
jgi:hypothetical protein